MPAYLGGHALLGVAAPSASLLALSRLAPATYATIGGCRPDPVVTLSNGDALDLHTTVDDAYTEFQLVSHTLPIAVGTSPIAVGTSVTSEVPTSVLDPHDTSLFHADEPPSTYGADAKVDTLTPQIAVVAAMDLVSVNGTVVATASASGQSRQMLWTTCSG